MTRNDHHVEDSSESLGEGTDLLDELRVTVVRDHGELNELFNGTSDLAERTGLVIYPTLPGHVDTYHPLTATAMDAPTFVDLAHRCGSALLYVHRDIALIDPDSDMDGSFDDDGPMDSTTATLYAEATSLEGRIAAIILGFPHAGVVHTWTATAPWASTFDTVCEYLADQTADDDRLLPARHASMVDNAKIRSIAERLAQLTEVRRNGTLNLDQAKDSELAELTAEHPHAGYSVREALNNVLHAERDNLERELSEELANHAAELAAQRDFRTARTVDMRRRLTDNYLRTFTNGLALSASLRNELEAQARACMRTGTQPML